MTSDSEGFKASRSHPCGDASCALPPSGGCLLCKGADDDEGADYCRACGRVFQPLPCGA